MKTHDLIFSSRPKSSIAKRLLYDYKDLTLAPYGEYWRQMHRICMLQLLSTKQVQSFKSAREEETYLMIKKDKEQSCSSTSLDLSEMLVSLTNNIICRVSFGRKNSGPEGGRKNMFSDGTYTTFITLDWGMTELILNLKVMEKAQS
ncbi:hypothetical protein HHK36_025055 [Tetracentron sinense]|uniref:Cytochrome P450 n=1 Tax=Tetracentron sinense TaxID=13715 RepID=A0A835D4P1_TETSI|nr:hypothetical protein HHK36_025055 [Tetracentron sinense]